MSITRTENDALAEKLSELAQHELVSISRGDASAAHVILAPQGKKVHSLKPLLDQYLTAPERRKGTAHLTSVESFIEHVKRFKDDDTVIFGDPNPAKPRLLAVFDYNPKGPDGKARFGEHRAEYAFPVSEEWSTWKAQSGRQMEVKTFAAFLEDHILEIAHPSRLDGLDPMSTPKRVAEALGINYATPQRLMQLSKGLAIRAEQKVVEMRNLQSGESELVFQETHADAETGTPLSIPGGFLITIPVFRGAQPWVIAAQLCYRKGPPLTWHYKLYRIDMTWDAAIKEACDFAAKDTECPLFMGTPEGDTASDH